MARKRKATAPGVAAIQGNVASENICQKNTPFSISCQSTAAAAQRRRILEHLQHDTLTTLQARSMGIMHPGMRVCELRQQGHQITTEWANEYCTGGVRHRVARYRLEVAHD